MEIEQVKTRYDNAKTFANVKSTLKRVNEIMGYSPVLVIHEDKYVTNFTEMVRKLLDAGFADNKTTLLSKLFLIAGAINRFQKPRNEFSSKLMELKVDTTQVMPDKPVAAHTARPWADLLPIFERIIKEHGSNSAKIVAVCFKHGYALRVAEIFDTTLKRGYPESAQNYLDLDGKMWYIEDHKNAGKTGSRKFPVTQAFVDELRKYVKLPDYLLIFKSNYTPYSTQTLPAIGIDPELFTNNEIRNSYEEWNWKQSGRTLKEKRFWSEEVLGHQETVAKKYYTSHVMESEIMGLGGEQPAKAFLEDTTGKIASSGKIRPKITKKPEQKSAEIAVQTEEEPKKKRTYKKRQ